MALATWQNKGKTAVLEMLLYLRVALDELLL